MTPLLDTSLLERITDGIIVLDRTWTFVYVNAAAARLAQREPADLVGRVIWELFPEFANSSVERNYRHALEHQEVVEFEDFFSSRDRWYAIRVFPSSDGVAVVLRDSSARHAADRALEALLAQSRREQRLAAVLAETNEAVFRSTSPRELFDAAARIAVEHGGFVMCWIGILDPETGEVANVASAGSGARDYLAIARVTSYEGPYGRGVGGIALRTGVPACSNDILTDQNMAPWREPAARVGYRSSGAFPLFVGGGVAGVLSVYAPEPRYFDTEEVSLVRRLAANVSYGWESLLRESALREADVARLTNQRFREVLSAAPTAILGVSDSGRLEFVNRQAERLLRRPAVDLIGELADELLQATDGRGIEELKADLADNAPAVADGLQFSASRGDGSKFPAEVALRLIAAENGKNLLLASVHDLTERLELEKERRLRALEAEREQADRLDSLGKLAGGVAHDFNNLLGVILNYTTLLARHVDEPGVRGDLDKIRAAAQRGAELTRQLLTFARRDVAYAVPLDVNEAVRAVAAMLNRVLGEAVVLRLRLATTPVIAVVDSQQLDQVILNLVFNARDAMPDGGQITISTMAADCASSPGAADTKPAQRVAVLRVSDTGVGMPPDVIARAFEPFFTTKPRGQGTGLGLAAVYGILDRSGGKATIDSAPGVGTTVTIELPSSDSAPVPVPVQPPSGGSAGNQEGVLLVEDDANLRETTERILCAAGYRVLVAGDGVEALEVLGEHAEEIAVVLSDVVMPRMGGDELARELGERVHPVPVLLMSAYDSGEHPQTARLLRKPIDEEDLVRALRETLDA